MNNDVYPKTVARKPLIALAAALIMPGLGQIYNGDVNRGMLYFLGVGIATPVSAWIAFHGPESIAWLVLLVISLVAIGVYIYAVVNAYRTAKNLSSKYTLKACNLPYVYISLFVFGLYFYSNLIAYTRTTLVESFYIPSTSMVPTILKGDVIFADKRVNCNRCKNKLRRGDVVIFVNPNDRTQLFIKRLIALPGDKVIINETDVTINGKKLTRKIVDNFKDPEHKQRSTTHTTVLEKSGDRQYQVIWKKAVQSTRIEVNVPNGQAFLLGDNRSESKDSRHVGTVPLVDIVGKAKQIWFSKRPGGKVRWNRIGRLIDTND